MLFHCVRENPGQRPHAMPDCSETPRALADLTFAELVRESANAGVAEVHAGQLWRALYRSGGASLADYPARVRGWLAERFGGETRLALGIPEVAAHIPSADKLTDKYLLRMADGQTIETVLMSYTGRFTACVSTQAGCAMGCVFCATGQMGFARHLQSGEIVAQVLHAQRQLAARSGAPLRNLVLMGMGEPLHNYDAVMAALSIISERRGINLGSSHITISTVGVVPGILRLAEERLPYHLAVSLHGASEEERSALVPASRRWPLSELISACRAYSQQTGRRIFFEWALIDGQSDSPAQAGRLAELLRGMDAHVNLIPLNPTSGYQGSASEVTAGAEFQRVLRAAGLPSTIRQRRGIDVAAGCGQLRAEKTRAPSRTVAV
jgi:23S rRNA (adenine2503-C2)-methyltransferase